jgi:hypothetical protein
MPTDYTATPTLIDRIRASELVVVGRVGPLLRIEPFESSETPRVFGSFEFLIERTLFGEPPAETIHLRLLGEGRNEAATWIVPVEEGSRYLGILAHDAEADSREERFAPLFSGLFPVDDRDQVEVPRESIDELVTEVAGFSRPPVPLEGFTRLVELVATEREERERQLDEAELGWLRDEPYPTLEEIPPEAEASPRFADLAAPDDER